MGPFAPCVRGGVTRTVRHCVPWLAVFGAALAWRILLIAEWPPVYSWDGFTRLWEADRVVVRHWLPIPQLLVMLLNGPLLLRGAFALCAALGITFIGLGVGRAWGRREGLLTGWALAFMPTVTVWTIVPYQESVFLLFTGLALAAWSKGLPGVAGAPAWLGAAAMACACLARYEAYALAALFGIWALVHGRWRAAKYLAPAGLVIVLWAVALAWIEPGTGPPRYGPPTSGGFGEPIGAVAEAALHATAQVSVFAAAEMTPFVAVLALGGAVVVIRRRPALWAEMLGFALVLFGLGVARTVNARVMTDRMPVLLLVWLAPFAAAGWCAAIDRMRSSGPRTVLTVGAMVILVLFYAAKSRNQAAIHSTSFEPEAQLAEELARVPPTENVAIFTRRIPNILRESSIGAVFANSPQLDRRSPRWSFPGKSSAMAEPDLVVYWRRNAYQMSPAPPPLKAAVRNREPPFGGKATNRHQAKELDDGAEAWEAFDLPKVK